MNVVMMGATGAVGNEVVRTLVAMPSLGKLSLLGRRDLDDVEDSRIKQHKIDIFKSETYRKFLTEHQCAICTLGVGQPSTMTKEEFLKIDKQAVLDFATGCKAAGVSHFQLLSSVGADSKSLSFHLRSKGELQDALRALEFERLSLFQPSMILTEKNRYGVLQAITLAVWPALGTFFIGPFSKYRGVPVEKLGRSIALNAYTNDRGVQVLQWGEIDSLVLR